MQKFTASLPLLTIFVFAGLQAAQAQTKIELGPRIGLDIDDVEEFFVGVDARFSPASLPVQINLTFDYYFVDDVPFFREFVNISLIQIGINALYQFEIEDQGFTPYAGAGLAITRSSVETSFEEFAFGDTQFSDTDTEAGLNLIGGTTFGSGSLKPFAQLQLTLGDAEFVTIGGGLLFRVGGN